MRPGSHLCLDCVLRGHPISMILIITLTVMQSLALSAGSSLSCLDNDGNAVPWWFMYKTAGGYEFAYADATTTTTSIQKFPRYMNDTSNPIALTRTLRALVEDKRSWFQYNDQPDIGTASSSYGHSKGVVAIDPASASGFWITHSTPKFPASSGSSQFYFPETEIKYGQTFLCVELSDRTSLNNLGDHLQYIKPFLYFSTLESSDVEGFPNLQSVLNGNWTKQAGTTTHKVTVGQQTFTTLSKNAAWESAMWGELVAPTFESSLVVQSWIRGYQEGPYCPPAYEYSVVDTETLQMPDGSGHNQTWTEGADHSKWAVSTKSSGKTLACIGDINRMTSQFKRGGGAICVEGTVLHDQLREVVVTTSTC